MPMEPMSVGEILNRVYLLPTKTQKLRVLETCINMMRREVDLMNFNRNALPRAFAFFMDALYELEIQHEHVSLFMDEDPPNGGAVMAVGVDQVTEEIGHLSLRVFYMLLIGGFGALNKGLIPNSVKVVPSIAIALVTYERVRELLGVEIRISH